jgi:hypothetical protein
MHRRTGPVFVDRSRFLRVWGGASAFAVGLVGFGVAACSSSQSGRPVTVTPTQRGSGEATGLRAIYHATFAEGIDPSAQTITFLSDGGGKFRITYDPPAPQEFAVSDGVKEVDSAQGLLEYGTMVHPSFRFGAEDLPQLCPEPTRAGRTTVLGRAADRYACKPAEGDQFSEVTLDSGNGLLLAAKSEISTIAATSIDVNATIPAGSFDVPIVTTPPAPTEGLLNSKSPGVPDAQSAATAIEKCRADTHGALPPPIRATKGPKVILHCGARTETFAVTPGNSVEYQPKGDQYEIVVTLPDGSMIAYASSKCPGTPLCINNNK